MTDLKLLAGPAPRPSGLEPLRGTGTLTIAEISQDSGIPRPTIHHWLKTPYLSKFDSATINNFCEYFGCEIGDLLEREPEAAG